jgi:xanthine/CO dehydrogenase XdhC/CoxF family maturation factor
VDEDGNAVGSISGGCVEGAVYELCRQVLRDLGTPRRAWFGYSDDDAFAVGLTCGGELDVFVQRIDPAAQRTCPRPSARSIEGDRSPWHRSWTARSASSAPR